MKQHTYEVRVGWTGNDGAAEVSLGRLNRDVPEKELDLLQFTARGVTQSGTRSLEVMRC